MAADCCTVLPDMRTHNDWSIFYQEGTLGDAASLDFAGQHCDGIIARIDTLRQRNRLLKLKIPVVDLRGRWDIPQFPRIVMDDRAVSELAAQHLLARGSRHFAFCGFAGTDYSRRRRNYFALAIEAAGYRPHVYESPARRAVRIPRQTNLTRPYMSGTWAGGSRVWPSQLA